MVGAGIVLPFAVQSVEVAAPVAPGLALTVLSSALGVPGGFVLRQVVIAAGVKRLLGAPGMLFVSETARRS